MASTELTRRWKCFIVTPETYFAVLRGEVKLSQDFPPGSRPVGLSYETGANSITMYVENEAFEPVVLGDEIPLEILRFDLIHPYRH